MQDLVETAVMQGGLSTHEETDLSDQQVVQPSHTTKTNTGTSMNALLNLAIRKHKAPKAKKVLGGGAS